MSKIIRSFFMIRKATGITRFLVILIALCFFTECFSRKKMGMHSNKKQERKHSRHVRTTRYNVYIEGVECEHCAQSVVDALKKIEGVYNVAYHVDDDCYEKGYAIVQWQTKAGMPDVSAFNEVLKDEQFTVLSLHGEFKGTFKMTEASEGERRVFELFKSEQTFFLREAINNPLPLSDQQWESLEKKRAVSIQATLWFDDKEKNYKLSLK